MNVTLFSFTKQASRLSLEIQNYYKKNEIDCISYTMEKYADQPSLTAFPTTLKNTVSSVFQKENALIFIGACGIAVRSIAPFIQSKTTDPCVVVVDEKAQYVISLLSGHIGGGNAFTTELAQTIGATPIISTATDLNQRFAVDVFAKEHQLALSDMKIAKEISAKLLDQEEIGISGPFPLSPLPKGLVAESTKATSGICITPFKNQLPFAHTLHLIPKQVVLGIGCKRKTDPEKLKNFVLATLEKHSIYPQSIACIASIDIKKEEKAILKLANTLSVPFITYTADELLAVPGDFTASAFVKSITGVDNVCERSSLAYSKAQELYLPKTAHDGCTIAISLLHTTLGGCL